MQIDISHVIGQLETACNQAGNLEVSGYGFIRQEGNTLVVYDACVLDVGSYGETNINPKVPEVAQKLLDLLERQDAPNLKLWWHRHPILGWSGRLPRLTNVTWKHCHQLHSMLVPSCVRQGTR